MAAPAVRTLSRYLLRQHVAPLGFALAALTALMLVNTMAKQLSALLGKGLPTGVIVEVFVLSIPFIVAVTLNGIESTNTSTITPVGSPLPSSAESCLAIVLTSISAVRAARAKPSGATCWRSR